jgi:hypothetical protein
MIVALMLVMGWSRPALAQEKVGLTMGYPTAVGLLWQVSDRVAVRPEFSWAQDSFESDSTFSQASSDSTGVSFAISALVSLRQWGAVRSYVAPRFETARTTTETTLETPSLFPAGFSSLNSTSETTKTTGTTYEGGASFGVQAAPAPHFGVFGEVGLMYARGKVEGTESLLERSSSTSRGRTVGIRSAIGVILFF